MLLEEQTWWDAAQTRRTFYGRILQADLLPLVVGSASAERDEVLRGVEAWRDRTLPRLFAILDQPAVGGGIFDHRSATVGEDDSAG
jgi:hypothetical protein